MDDSNSRVHTNWRQPRRIKEKIEIAKKNHQILYNRWQALQKRIHLAIIKMLKSSGGKICDGWNTWRMLWQTFWAYNYGKEDIRADYYWSTIETDIANYVQRCERCHKCAYNHIHQQTSCATWYLHGYFFGGRLAYYDLTQELRDKLNIW